MPVNYQHGKIYKIWSPSHPDEVYIGSTAEPRLTARMSKHRSAYKRYQEGIKKGYMTSFKTLAYEDCRIDLIEKYPCNDKCELRAREGHYIKTINCVNKMVAGRKQKQYVEDNKEVIRQKKKVYREMNKEKISNVKKAWREKNVEYVKQMKKEYHNKFGKQKITCECGAVITKSCIVKHRKRQVHIKAMKNK